MKKVKIIFTASALVFLFTGCGSNQKTEAKEETKTDSTAVIPAQANEKVIYQCPMHPEEISDKAGQCSKCGMDLERVVIRGNDTIRTTE